MDAPAQTFAIDAKVAMLLEPSVRSSGFVDNMKNAHVPVAGLPSLQRNDTVHGIIRNTASETVSSASQRSVASMPNPTTVYLSNSNEQQDASHSPSISGNDLVSALHGHLPPFKLLKKGRMIVTVNKATTNYHILRPYVRITLENQVFQTSVSGFSTGDWFEGFEIKVSLHSLLFSTLLFDLYDANRFLRENHVGRAEIRLSTLLNLPSPITSWFEVWRKSQTLSNLSSLSRRTIYSDNLGALQLKFQCNFEISHNDDNFINHTLQTIPKTVVYPGRMRSHENQQPDISSKLSDARCLENRPEESKFAVEEDPVIAELRKLPSVSATDVAPVSKCQCNYFDRIDAGAAEHSCDVELSAFFGMNDDPDGDFLFHSFDEFEEDNPVRMQRDKKQREPSFLQRFFSKETYAVYCGFRTILSVFVQGLDYSWKDLMGGFLMLEKFYKYWDRPRTHDLVCDAAILAPARHYFKFGIAVYGWRGLIKQFRDKTRGYISDLMKGEHHLVSRYLNITTEDLLKYDFRGGKLFQPSYVIAMDKSTNSLVVSIRGTINLADLLTDLTCSYEAYKGGYVHSGILACANWFVKNIKSDLIRYSVERKPSKLIILGHSLGGAVATCLLVSLLDFRQEFPADLKIHCFAFGSPPTMSLNLSHRYTEYITSFVHADDMICRLSLGSMMDLRNLLLCAIEQGESSFTLLYEQLQQLVFGEELYRERELSEKSRERLASLRRCREVLYSEFEMNRNPKLFQAGIVYHLYKKPTELHPNQTLMERIPTEMITEIICCRNMLFSHIPWQYSLAMDRALSGMSGVENNCMDS